MPSEVSPTARSRRSRTFRRGITDVFTAELRGETQVDGASALGIDTAWQLGTLGVLSTTAGRWLGRRGLGLARRPRSRAQRRAGASLRAHAVRVRALRPGRQLGVRAARRSSAASPASASTSRASAAYSSPTASRATGTSESVETLGSSYSTLARRRTASSTCSPTTAARRTRPTDVYLSWTMPLRRRRTVGASLAYRPDVPIGDTRRGHGHAAAEPAGWIGHGLLPERLEQRGRAGKPLLPGTRRPGGRRVFAPRRNRRLACRRHSAVSTLTSAGVLPTRWLDQSFAVVAGRRLPRTSPCMSRTSRSAARTKEAASCWTACAPTTRNDVSLDPAELPLDASLAKARVMLTPAWRSGAVVALPNHPRRRRRRCGWCRITASRSRPARESIRPAARRPSRSTDWCT